MNFLDYEELLTLSDKKKEEYKLYILSHDRKTIIDYLDHLVVSSCMLFEEVNELNTISDEKIDEFLGDNRFRTYFDELQKENQLEKKRLSESKPFGVVELCLSCIIKQKGNIELSFEMAIKMAEYYEYEISDVIDFFKRIKKRKNNPGNDDTNGND